MDKIRVLLKTRKKRYGDAHKYAGYAMGLLKEPFTNLLIVGPQFSHNWVLMLSKLIRILFDPYYIDNYDDLIGYATLCKQMAEKGKDNDDTLQT